jgi:lysozyme family protein
VARENRHLILLVIVFGSETIMYTKLYKLVEQLQYQTFKKGKKKREELSSRAAVEVKRTRTCSGSGPHQDDGPSPSPPLLFLKGEGGGLVTGLYSTANQAS